ncbi:MAG: thermosome subunit, partial [Candidatus Diapherotrites archaeon]|nr:thermosome subunit [Candidatus Diapherotrites archaeon]
GKYVGVNVYAGKISDMKNERVIEPLRVKTQAIDSASEVAEMILRIDDIILGSGKPAPGPGMDMGGMGGMPGMM